MSSAANSTSDLNDHGDDDIFDWDKKAQGLLLSAYFYGYIFPNLLGGILAEIYGARKVIFIAMLSSSIVTLLSPFAAHDNFLYMFIMRLVLGFLAGFFYPASHQLISKWSVQEEKGKFVSCLLGGVFGSVVGFPLTGYLVENYSWRAGFQVIKFFTLKIKINFSSFRFLH